MEAADELGMFIELEMPLCWDRSSDTPQGFLYTIQVHMEAVTFNRHHASVIAWSLANESPWGPTFTTYVPPRYRCNLSLILLKRSSLSGQVPQLLHQAHRQFSTFHVRWRLRPDDARSGRAA